MSRRFSAGLAIALGVAMAGCSERQEQLPTASPSFVVNPACDFKTIRDGVRDYFASGDQTAVNEIVRQMEDACDAGEPGTVRDRGFDVLAEVERVFYDGTQAGTPAQGGALIQALFDKMGLTTPTGATLASAVSPGGAIGVRGGEFDPNTEAVLSNGNTVLWGVAPNPNFRTMSGSVRFVLLGYPIGDFTPEVDFGTFYQWYTVPTVTFNPEAIVGACLPTPDQALIQNDQTILNFIPPPFCPEPAPQASGPMGQVLRFAQRLLMPQPALAAAVLAARGSGGGASTFSPNAVVTAGSVHLEFTSDGQPADGKILEPIQTANDEDIKVRASGDGGTAIEGVTITITSLTNKGATVEPCQGGAPSNCNVAITGTDGVAHFASLTLNKAGGYRLKAVSDLAAYADAQAISQLFNLKR